MSESHTDPSDPARIVCTSSVRAGSRVHSTAATLSLPPSPVAPPSSLAPSSEEMESGANYYGASVDPVVFDLTLDAGAAPGAHAIPAQLKYYYCVKKSGFCAPKKTAIEIPVTIR